MQHRTQLFSFGKYGLGLILQQQLQARLRVPTLLVESKEDVLSASAWVLQATDGDSDSVRDRNIGGGNLRRMFQNLGVISMHLNTLSSLSREAGSLSAQAALLGS